MKKQCPICGRPVVLPDVKATVTSPFCSDRCRNVDLSRWFQEAYQVPVQTERVINEDAEALMDALDQ